MPQFVTFRLADSLPAEKLLQWRQELSHLPRDEKEAEYQRRIEEYLDRGEGDVWLSVPEVAVGVQNAFLHFDGERYELHAWVVMPNHVHALFTPSEGQSLSAILHSWKSFTSKMANQLLGRRGDFWQEDYFDRFARNAEGFERFRFYIEMNPVTAGLCAEPEEWPYSSARCRR